MKPAPLSATESDLPPKKRSRKDPRKAATIADLLNAAERLFGKYGIDGVSLRQLGVEIGSSNKFVAQYHIGDKTAVVKALFEMRLDQLEKRRAVMLDHARAHGATGDARTLLEILFRPISEVVDSNGRHSFAAFLCSLMLSNYLDIRAEMNESAPISKQVIELLQQAAPPRLADRFVERSLTVSMMVCMKIACDTKHLYPPAGEAAFQELLDMAAAAFTVPAPP